MRFETIADKRNKRPMGIENRWDLVRGHMVAEVRMGIGRTGMEIDGYDVNGQFGFVELCDMVRDNQDIPIFEMP